jgi:hypothetical protein
MDINTIASAAVLMKSSQTQQAMETTLIKQAAEQQNMFAGLLAQNVRMSPQPSSITGFGFSTYA